MIPKFHPILLLDIDDTGTIVLILSSITDHASPSISAV